MFPSRVPEIPRQYFFEEGSPGTSLLNQALAPDLTSIRRHKGPPPNAVLFQLLRDRHSSSKFSESVMHTEYERDTEYYMETTTVLLDNCLFKIPLYYFSRYSDVFSTAFTLPPPIDGMRGGQSDQNPIKLEGVSKDDFRGLLRAMYPTGPAIPGKDLVLAEWISALKLATMWGFAEIRRRAI
ncbi:hypothetical protein P691DRAFT_762826 [Macrolepiota fuliginosa MF-IS2]|uniref:BTB domain-containing protein n=1 Tax=Macrolepiota fuliginosa MF-IS2 TaxID=1400762 RepID=A0A9P6C0X4_9AGAR|nr:hypothetical protein P691DRAFT_762826 [Macrolepiota fuliginosa MF-IS2]